MIRFMFLALFSLASLTSHAKDVYVKGYTRKDGTYVAPHVRSSPNSTVLDNYSYRTPAYRPPTVPTYKPPPIPKYTPYSVPTYRPPAAMTPRSVCNDGWVSPASGSGACSSHGGVARPAAATESRNVYASPTSTAAPIPRVQPTSTNYVGARFQDPGSADFSYQRLDTGEYAIFYQGRRTDTARKGTGAWDTIKKIQEP
jgi:hypothetical protein